MKYHSNDTYIENYMALAVSILGNCSPDTAFRRLDKGVSHENHKWTWEDIDAIQAYRNQGMKWKDIAEIFGTSATGAHKNFNYWKRNKRRT